ncbi:putative deoxyribonuclease YcfH [compost metagenome]
MLAQVPLDRLLIETDAPYLTPHPFRGKRNETGYVRLVAETAAEIRGMTLEEIAEITTNNAIRLLGLK